MCESNNLLQRNAFFKKWHGVYINIVYRYRQVKVRACWKTCGADISDNIALFHHCVLFGVQLHHMIVPWLKPITVLDYYGISGAYQILSKKNPSIIDRLNRSSLILSYVKTIVSVWCRSIINIPPLPEVLRGDPAAFNRLYERAFTELYRVTYRS